MEKESSDDIKSDSDMENKPPPVIMFIGFSTKFMTVVTERVIQLGARVTSELKEVTHLVCWQVVTSKLYIVLGCVKYIVGAPWIRDSCKAKHFVDESQYTVQIEAFEKYHNVKIGDILKRPDRHLLFKGLTFYITPGIVNEIRQDLEDLIEVSGGQVDRAQKSMLDVRTRGRRNPRKYLIITLQEDYDYFIEFFANRATNKPMSIFTIKFVQQAVAEQKFDLEPPSAREGQGPPKVEPITV